MFYHFISAGNDNVVGNDFGSGNNVTFNGDNNVNSNIVTDSILEKSNMNVEFPWSELSKQLQQIVNNASVLSEQSIEILKDLLAATEKNSESEFTVIVAPALLIAFIVRGEKLIYPDGNDQLEPHDRVIVVTTQKNFDDIIDILE